MPKTRPAYAPEFRQQMVELVQHLYTLFFSQTQQHPHTQTHSLIHLVCFILSLLGHSSTCPATSHLVVRSGKSPSS